MKIPTARPRRRRTLECGLLAVAALLGLGSLALSAPRTAAAARKVDFSSQVAPILNKHCVTCHGPQLQMGEVRLDSAAAVLKAGAGSRKAVIPGKASASRLIHLITATKAGERMPPQGPRLASIEVDLIRRWIDEGASSSGPSAAASGNAAAAGSSGRTLWWSFRPLRRPAIPTPTRGAPTRNPVDRFILAAMEKKKLSPSPPADRARLVRRLYFDLVGLPPTPEEVDSFVRDPDPGAYEKLVDRLLTRPQFGERWARHWLDLARYADSNGQEGDQDRPTAYHYRDWVIRSLNDDIPYDTFVRLQIAGDEYQPDNPAATAATGFLTAGPHTVLNVPMEEEKTRNRLNELDDIVSTTGSAFLGLTVACARCHDHKFDPIPTRDYYRLLTAFDAGDRAEAPLADRAAIARQREGERQWESRVDEVRQAIEELRKPHTARLLHPKIDGLPLRDAQKMELKENPESDEAKIHFKKFAARLKIEDEEYRKVLTDEQRSRWDSLAAELKRLESERPAPIPTALAHRDAGAKPRETWLLARGDLHLKKEPVELGFISALTFGPAPADYWARAKAAGDRTDTTFQRRAVADWITDTRHGAGALLARVMANRIWQGHFGEGIVRTPNDFGINGESPDHPELLEWLASELVDGGWRMKRLHRLIVTSDAYRQDTAFVPAKARIDPDNRLLWRRTPRRVEAEIFRDAMLAVSGTLNAAMYGPAVRPPLPAEAIQARNLKDPYPKNIRDSPENRRRTLYLFHKRVVQYPLLQVFDAPDASASCGRRSVTTVAPQALAVLNEPFIRLRAADLAGRLKSEAGVSPAARITLGYRLALARSPRAGELKAALKFLQDREEARLAREGAKPEQASLLALTDFAQVLFGLNEFVYID